jgi:cell wall-associated NlpC family hydrolase
LTGQKQALEALKGALEGEKASELDLRQAKVNVSVAQSRLNDLKRTGKTRSVDYKQAQIDLERAQLALRRQTDAYKDAQKRANAATSGAATATQRAATPVRTLGLAAQTGGQRAGAARVPWRKLGEDAAHAMAKIHSKRARITANFGWQGLEVFRVGPKGQTRLAFAEGGEVYGPGTSTSDSIPARLSRGEHVWSAREVRGAGGHRAVEGLRREARGFAQGGTIPQFGMTGTGGFVKALNSWESRVTKILDVGAKAFGNTVKAIGGNPTIKRFILGTDPLPYRWGAAGPGAYDCSGLVGAVYGKLTGRGGGHGQRYFTTSSISTAVPGLKPGLGGVFQVGVTAGTGHMAGRYGGLGFEAESTRTGIKVGSAASRPESFARHFHMARGGPVDDKKLAVLSQLRGVDVGGDAGKLRINGKVFDRGGYLMPGATLAVNRTGRPEPVGAGRLTLQDARMIAAELARVIPTTIRVDDVHQGLRGLRNRRQRGLGLE